MSAPKKMKFSFINENLLEEAAREAEFNEKFIKEADKIEQFYRKPVKINSINRGKNCLDKEHVQKLVNEEIPGPSSSTQRVRITDNNEDESATKSISANEDKENDANQEIDNYINILNDETSHTKKFGLSTRKVTFTIKAELNPLSIIYDALPRTLNFIKEGTGNSDKVGVCLRNASFNHKPIYVSYRRADQITADVLYEEIQKVVQSNEEFLASGPFELKYTRIGSRDGRKRTRGSLLYDPSFLRQNKRSIVQINNTDQLCLPRALVTGIALIHKDDSQNDTYLYDQMRRGRRIQQEKALELCQNSGVDINEIGGGIQALRLFQSYLSIYKITVFEDFKARKVMFQDPSNKSNLFIDLLYINHHYDLINSITGFCGYNLYCRDCNVGFSNPGAHRCPNSCKKCFKTPPCEFTNDYSYKCPKCEIIFNNPNCFQKHSLPHFLKKKSVCDIIRYCSICRNIYSLENLKEHKCGYVKCITCSKYVPYPHLCFIQPLRLKNQKTKLFLFFDFECRQDDPLCLPSTSSDINNCRIHIPNFCVIQKQCNGCCEDDMMHQPCIKCGERQYILDQCEGEELLAKFFDYIRQQVPHFDKIYIIAHNFKGYDGQFILKYMVETLHWEPEVILNGGLIQHIKYDKLIFRDSLNFFNAPLSSLPKMMGIEELKKGYFPHFFNTKENQNYVGELPAMKFYGVDEMRQKERDNFIIWWNKEKSTGKCFNFYEEMKSYCKSDVDILRRATLKFRQLYIKIGGVDPLDNVTIAGACMKLFRTKYLKPQQIGLMPYQGYRANDKQSIEALKWMKYLESHHKIKILTMQDGPEKKIGGFKVDGYCSNFNGKETIFEYHGCFYHGCPTCFPDRTVRIKSSSTFDTMDMRYKNTLFKTGHLKSLGYDVIETWSCQFQELMFVKPEIGLQINNMKFEEPLDPRHAFFGGRTEMFQKYACADETSVIKYFDVCSLYPYICKYGIFPIGHPEIITDESKMPRTLKNYVGFAKVDILPPQQLLFPVLPFKEKGGKLLFGLCRRCMRENNQNTCSHSEEERLIHGTYTCCELQEAENMGYKIKKIFELWSYNSTQFDGRNGGIFAGYIDTFLKIKQEASGYPSRVQSDQDKENYIKEMENREKICLDPSKIESNPGLRSLAKMALNSLWGKFSQRSDLPQTNFVSSEDKLQEFMNNPAINVTDIVPLSDNMLIVNWKHVEEDINSAEFTSIAVASYVTAQARLHLYKFLKFLGSRVIYCDTDSVFFTEKTGDPELEKGDFLGQMTDELDSWPGSYISEFISEGPKNYAYKVKQPHGEEFTVCKVRGLTLNYSASEVINFDTMKEFVLSADPDPLRVEYNNKIQRKKYFTLCTSKLIKKYNRIEPKRRLLPNMNTLPFGFVD